MDDRTAAILAFLDEEGDYILDLLDEEVRRERARFEDDHRPEHEQYAGWAEDAAAKLRPLLNPETKET